MTASTDTIREWWAPHCQGPFASVTLFGGGKVTVDPLIVPAVKALDACLRAHDYEATAPDVGAYNCRVITGGTKYSLHAYGIALDINWQANPYGKKLVTDMPAGMVAAIKAIRTNGGAQVWRWGGDYSGNKDAMHYEVVASPAELATGIAGSQEEDDMFDQPDRDHLIDVRQELEVNIVPAIGRIEAQVAAMKKDLDSLDDKLVASLGLLVTNVAERLEKAIKDG